MKKGHKNRQKGMALLMVLMLVAIMTTIGVSLSERFFLQVKQTQYQQTSLQAKWYFSGAQEAIRGVLWRDFKDDESKTHLGQYWASDVKQFPLDDALLKFKIKDGYSCFNLNSLNQKLSADENEAASDTYVFDSFIQLLRGVGIDDYVAIEMAASVQDWIDEDDIPRPYGAEDTLYASLQPSYITANQPLFDMSELRLINGFSPETIAKIKPFICVLPKSTLSININTLRTEDAAILTALSLGTWDEAFARSIIEKRPRNGWNELIAFYDEAGLAADDELRKQLDQVLVLHSQFFIADLTLQFEDHHFMNQSVLQRTENGISVIFQKIEVAGD